MLITVLIMLAVLLKADACACSLQFVDVDMALKYYLEYSIF